MLRLSTILIVLALAAGCRTVRTPVVAVRQASTSDSVVNEVRETVLDYMAADSAHMVALISADTSGNLAIESLQYTPGKNVTGVVSVAGRYIYLKCRVDSAEVYRRYSRYFHARTMSDSTHSIVQITHGGTSAGGKIARWFHQGLHAAGYMFIALGAAVAVYFIFKLRKLFSIL